MDTRPLTVAWCSYFPVEWLPDAPEVIRRLPRRHPASWLQAGVEEFKQRDNLKLHVIELRKGLREDVTFDSGRVTFHCLKVPGGLRAPTLFWLDTFLIRRRLKQVRPDAIHAWGSEKGAALVASRLAYPYLVSLQGLMQYFSELLDLKTYERAAAWFERVSLRRARVASGESTFVVNWLRRHYPHLEVHHVEHTPTWTFYGVKREPETRPIQFLFIGSIGYRKGTDLLLLALDRLRKELDFRLTLIGFSADAEFLDRLKSQTSAELWDRVNLLRTAPTSQVLEHMGRATMVLFPTRADTGPVAVKEAVIAGVPVIGSAMGGIPDYVAPGKNGLIFPPGDLEGFTNAIRQACAHPLFSRGQVDPAALADVRERLSPRRMADGFLQIYQRLAKRPEARAS
ncbi:MAG TPA: glycosyltransferase family 4 protein [Candidatus Paceibacterota bacterium]|nr:glycosyltransferase family 4 protein [Candidatus Paceibacterota bacterium]